MTKKESRLGKRILGFGLASAIGASVLFNEARASECEETRQSKPGIERVVEEDESKKAEFLLVRNQFSENSTVGDLYINGEFFCHTLELPYRNNQKGRSCIPLGEYGIKKRTSDEYGQHFLVTGTGERECILFHVGNYPKDTEGCILVGSTIGEDFVGNSRLTIDKLREKLEGVDDMKLKIENKEPEKPDAKYSEFKYQDEISDILKHAKRVGVEPELLMAIRTSENGADNLAYGIIPQGKAKEKYDSDKGYFLNGESYTYQNEIEKQLCWSAWTVRKNRERFEKNPNKGNFLDFIDFLGNIYCPVGAENDPNRLNANWEKNVREAYAKLKD